MPTTDNLLPVDYRVLHVLNQIQPDEWITGASIARRLLLDDEVHGYDCPLVRFSIRRLKRARHLILSNRRGYKLARTPAEIKQALAYHVKRIRGEVRELRAWAPVAAARLEAALGQIPLFKEAQDA